MKKYTALVLLFIGQFLAAQTTINQYQYVIVGSEFKDTKEPNQYRLNILPKLLLEKYGFKAYIDTDEIPKEITASKCNNLYADIVSSGNPLATKLQVVLKDCKKKVVYKSGVGKSNKKDFNTAYNQALRKAFESFETLHYRYQPLETVSNVASENNNTTIMEESFEQKDDADFLYAQAIPNGYQLVDATPKIVMKIFKTSSPNTFSATKGTLQGVLIMKDNQWFFEYYQEEKLISEKVNVKF